MANGVLEFLGNLASAYVKHKLKKIDDEGRLRSKIGPMTTAEILKALPHAPFNEQKIMREVLKLRGFHDF